MALEIRCAEKTDKNTIEIVVFSENSKVKSSFSKSLGIGEWFLEDATEKRIYFKVDSTWNDQEWAENFRSLAVKTIKYWGSKPHLNVGEEILNPVSSLRGLQLSNYNLGFYKEKKVKSTSVKLSIGNCKIEDLDRAKIEAEAQMWVMSLVDLPPNEKTPEKLGYLARQSAKNHGYECVVWNDDHITAAGLNTLHAVGRGSIHDPVFILSNYRGREDSDIVDIALIGKGITFDTGGISIKPSANMHYMKSDMAGASAMLGAIELAARLKLPLNITVVVPSAENSPGPNALLPGEVIKSYSGKSIEVIDTDAEGRLVLADGIAWAVDQLKPRVIVDMATLTGSSVRALGFEAAALYSENSELLEALREAGKKTGEQVWHMPLWKAYDSYIHSDIADVSNLPLKPVAGSIAAAKFLQVFTNNHPVWAHIDMPGMSFKDSPHFKTKSATGYGLFLLGRLMEKIAENPLKFGGTD